VVDGALLLGTVLAATVAAILNDTKLKPNRMSGAPVVIFSP
jgi:hypothetical protein